MPTNQKYRTARVAPPEPLSTFSYYGGKSKVIGRYPAPRHDLIIEPFGGAAAYGWRHRSGLHARHVWVNDIDPITVSIWEFLQSSDVADVLDSLPAQIEKGQAILDLVPAGAHRGLSALIHAELSRGTQGRRDVPSRATAFGAYYYWPRLALKFKVIAAAVAGWQITQRDYADIPNQVATWFIDPPYDNDAGRRYRHHAIDYEHLAEWCASRQGQVIVCENAGATWLPFQALVRERIGRHLRTTNVGEAMWHR